MSYTPIILAISAYFFLVLLQKKFEHDMTMDKRRLQMEEAKFNENKAVADHLAQQGYIHHNGHTYNIDPVESSPGLKHGTSTSAQTLKRRGTPVCEEEKKPAAHPLEPMMSMAKDVAGGLEQVKELSRVFQENNLMGTLGELVKQVTQ